MRFHEYQRSRVRDLDGADKVINRKPQAKDVLPARTLDENEERTFSEVEKELGPDKYLNPVVPKKRKYLATSKLPAFLSSIGNRNAADSQPSSSSSSPAAVNTREKTTPKSQPTPVFISQYSSPAAYHVAGTSYSESSNGATPPSSQAYAASSEERDALTVYDNLLYPEIAFLSSLRDMEENDSDGEESDELKDEYENTPLAEDTLEEGQMAHPEIPVTPLARKYLDMAESIKNSKLHSLWYAFIYTMGCLWLL